MAEPRKGEWGAEQDAGRDEDLASTPTVNQPLNADPRPRLRPVLLLVAFVAALVLLYVFALEVLVPAG